MKTKIQIRPLEDRVVLIAEEEPDQIGLIHIPTQAKEKPTRGKVISVGPGRYDRGRHIPNQCKPGDRVLFSKFAGTKIEIEGEEIIVIKEADIYAIL